MKDIARCTGRCRAVTTVCVWPSLAGQSTLSRTCSGLSLTKVHTHTHTHTYTPTHQYRYGHVCISNLSLLLSVFLFVCLFAHISQNHTSKFYQISCTRYLWPWLRPPLTAVDTKKAMDTYHTSFTFGFVDDVMFSHNRVNGQKQRRRVCFVEFARWRYRGRSLPHFWGEHVLAHCNVRTHDCNAHFFACRRGGRGRMHSAMRSFAILLWTLVLRWYYYHWR